MKKRILTVCLICVLTIGVLAAAFGIVMKTVDFEKINAEKTIVRVGPYNITKSEIETYYTITWLKNADSTDLKAAVLECVKEKIMEEEIKGTEHEITYTSKAERRNQTAEKFTETTRKYCEKIDISKDEFVEIAAEQDWYGLVETRHFAMFCETYMQNLDEEEKQTVVADEIIAAHEEYLNNKIAEMEYSVVRKKALKSLKLIEFKDLESFLQNNATEDGTVS